MRITLVRAAFLSCIAVLSVLVLRWSITGFPGFRRTVQDEARNAVRPSSAHPHSSLNIPLIGGVPLYPGRGRDGILPVDHPLFESRAGSAPMPADDEPVLGVIHNGIAKAYPLWILGAQEIINDTFGADRVCVTHCPLSASSVAFRARAREQELSFGNEGALYECNLVMFDRETRSLWYQLRGVAIHGALAGDSLERIPTHSVRWADWHSRFPSSLVLVADQKLGRFFRTTAQATGSGEAPSEPAAPVSVQDPALPAMHAILGFRIGERDWCVPMEALERRPAHFHLPGLVGPSGDSPEAFVSVVGDPGWITVLGPHGEELPATRAYWFAWRAAFPAGAVLSAATP